MSVGGIRGGGGGKRAGGPKGPASSTPAGKAAGKSFGKVDSTATLVGPSGAAGSSNVGSAPWMAAVSSAMAAVAKRWQAGEIKDKRDARKEMIKAIVRERMNMNCEPLNEQIENAIEGSPMHNQIIERILSGSR